MWPNVEQWPSQLDHSAVPVLVYTHSEANSQSHNQPRCLARTGLTSSHPECKLPLASPDALQHFAWKLLIFVCRALTQMKLRLKGAQKGHSLLKKKADALTLKFRQILTKIIEVSLHALKLLLFLGCSFPQWKHVWTLNYSFLWLLPMS